MTCPTDTRRIEPDGKTVLVCDDHADYVNVRGHSNREAAVHWPAIDPWSWSATCRECGGCGMLSLGHGDVTECVCADNGHPGVDPLDLVRLDPWVGATLRHDDGPTAVVVGEATTYWNSYGLGSDGKFSVWKIPSHAIDPDVGPWRVVARPAKETP